MTNAQLLDALNNVSDTLFITLLCRANETMSKKPIIKDKKAVEIVETLRKSLENSNKAHLKSLISHKLPKMANVSISLRSQAFDRYVLQFLNRHPGATIINLACGLDSRYERIDNGEVRWYDLDLPSVIELRRQFFNPSDQYEMLASSALDFEWIDKIHFDEPNEVMIIAEGFFMYLRPEQVKALVMNLKSHFPGCHLVFENTNAMWVNMMQNGWMKQIFQYKMQNQLKMGKDVLFHFGLSSGQEMEKWGSGIKFLDEWTYFSDKEPKFGIFNWFGRFDWISKTQWVLHFKLG